MDRSRLVRRRSNRMIAGVCGGVADFLGWNATLVRIGFVVFAFVGVGELVYLILWLAMPKAPY